MAHGAITKRSMDHADQQLSHLHYWLYVSRCRLPSAWAPKAIRDIVAISRARNSGLNVTGALLFTGSRFAQYLEGAQEAIEQLQASIRRDPRHHAVSTVDENEAATRRFGDWSLAYAGPSLFVADKVETVLDNAGELIGLLHEFSTTTPG
jgi:hypothetical protein